MFFSFSLHTTHFFELVTNLDRLQKFFTNRKVVQKFAAHAGIHNQDPLIQFLVASHYAAMEPMIILLINQNKVIKIVFSPDSRTPTPLYNTSMMSELVMMSNETIRQQTLENNNNLRDAIALLRVWLRQRNLDLVRFYHIC